MTAVTLDGASRGGRLPTIYSDDRHGPVDANEVVVSLEKLGMEGVDRRETGRKASDGTVATQSRMYLGLRCKMKKVSENKWLGISITGAGNVLC